MGVNIETTKPAQTFAAVTPSDTVNLTSVARSFFIGTGGNIVIVGLDDVAVTFKNVASGTTVPFVGKRVNSTNTTATDIVALY